MNNFSSINYYDHHLSLLWLALGIMSLLVIPLIAFILYTFIKFKDTGEASPESLKQRVNEGVNEKLSAKTGASWVNRLREKRKYSPKWDHSIKLELLIWGVPLLIVVVLGLITWVHTHLTDPYRHIAANELKIQVVSMDWKWAFAYPNNNLSVNELVLPAHTPVELNLTSQHVMNVFFIPKLTSQIYTMQGMIVPLHFNTGEAGKTYRGISANFSGPGFHKMKFNVKVVDAKDYEDYLQKTKQTLDESTAKALAKREINQEVLWFDNKEPLWAMIWPKGGHLHGSVMAQPYNDEQVNNKHDKHPAPQLVNTPVNRNKKEHHHE